MHVEDKRMREKKDRKSKKGGYGFNETKYHVGMQNVAQEMK